MRHEFYRMEETEALGFLAQRPVVHLATVGSDGQPILRTVHGVLVDGAVAFHGAPAGEKLEAVGQPAVISAEETVAEIPSYFLDPDRACPATTYYRSVQVHGVIERVDEPAAKARVMQALMEKLQPDGGYVPITAEDPLYTKAVAGILVLRVSLGRVDGKGKLGQNRKPEELASVVRQLWARGRDQDLRAIDLIRQANSHVALPQPLAAGTHGVPVLSLTETDWPAAAALLTQAGVEAANVAAHRRSGWVGLRDEVGNLLGTGRVASDGDSIAWIKDVAVMPGDRQEALATALLTLLLDHPVGRQASRVEVHARGLEPVATALGLRAVSPACWELLRAQAVAV